MTPQVHQLELTRRKGVAWLAAALLSPTAMPSSAQPPPVPAELASAWPNARMQGQGRLRFLTLQVYDIRLWTPEGPVGGEDWARRPLALEIEYRRALVGRQIAERSLEEMRRGGAIDPAIGANWLETMTRIFPDVSAGDRITGVLVPGSAARFFVNGAARGEVPDADFARRFFGIWLAPWTSEPKLRQELLGTT